MNPFISIFQIFVTQGLQDIVNSIDFITMMHGFVRFYYAASKWLIVYNRNVYDLYKISWFLLKAQTQTLINWYCDGDYVHGWGESSKQKGFIIKCYLMPTKLQ